MAKISSLPILFLSLIFLNFINNSFASSSSNSSQASNNNINNNKKPPKVGVYELKTKNISVKLTNYGATIISVFLPDKNGKVDDVVLGFDRTKDYVDDKTYFGALVGRVANRIAKAEYTYQGKQYKLVPNENGNILHGGPKGFSRVTWSVEQYYPEAPSPFITFTYFSKDGEEGFPGNLQVAVTYRVVQEKHLLVSMKAKPLNKPTPVNLAQHTYWNLGGHNSGTILEHEVQIFASQITPVDDQLIPTGKFEQVKGTPYDFLTPHTVGSRLNQLPNGYDINYVLDLPKQGHGPVHPVAIVKDKKSGRVMELFATKPGVQFYTSTKMNSTRGKGGYMYGHNSGIALETQGFPDSVNHPNFPSVMVAPGETYKHQMFYQFSTE